MPLAPAPEQITLQLLEFESESLKIASESFIRIVRLLDQRLLLQDERMAGL
jgi:hypothetical protein